MKLLKPTAEKVFNKNTLSTALMQWRASGKKIVFTNGVFDLIHKGHLKLLAETSSLGDILIVGVNSDKSVKRLKGPTRPINDEHTRSLLLAAMEVTDAIIVFEEDTPAALISFILPDVLVKGGDYSSNTIVGAEEVKQHGGEVVVIQLEEGYSSTNIIHKIQGKDN